MWQVEKVEKSRTKTTYAVGDLVRVTLINDANPLGVEKHVMIWGFDGSHSKTEFRNMVKLQVKQQITCMNRSDVFFDVLKDYTVK